MGSWLLKFCRVQSSLREVKITIGRRMKHELCYDYSTGVSYDNYDVERILTESFANLLLSEKFSIAPDFLSYNQIYQVFLQTSLIPCFSE